MSEGAVADSPIRVALICGSHLMAEALGGALAADPGVDLVDLVEGAEAGARVCGAEVVLIDAELGERVTIELIESLRAASPACRCVPLGARGVGQIVRCIEAGALGYVRRDTTLGETLRIVRAVHRGEVPCAPAVAAAVYSRIHELASACRQAPPALPADLTTRELEVLRLLAAGLRNKEIAARLGVAVSTAKNHVHTLLAKLEVGRRRDAAVLACRAGLVAADSFRPAGL